MIIWLLYGCLALLFVSFMMVLVRLQRGPTNMDRAIALDVITSVTVGIIVVVMAITGRIDLLALLVVFTSVGFISSTTIARFSPVETVADTKMMTPDEAAANPEPEFEEDDVPVHPDADDDEDDADFELVDTSEPGEPK